MHGVDQGTVELQQRFAAGEHHVFAGRISGWPQAVDLGRQQVRFLELAAAFAIGADEIGIAELAHGARAVGFAPGPEVAAGKPAKHGRPPSMGALALQGVEDLFDAVSHGKPLVNLPL